MTILVTGGAGYVGSILTRMLLEKGYQVRLLETFRFGEDSISDIRNHKNLEVMHGDITNNEDVNKALEDIEGVIHLAGIVGDPACAVNIEEAIETNFIATTRLARSCKEKKTGKFVYASTCSVYGAPEGLVDENSPAKPVSLYGETKADSEATVLALASEGFNPIIGRLATIYGISPRMRFDLVVNYLTMRAITKGTIKIFGGEQWRPFLNVYDAARGYIFLLEQDLEVSDQNIYNLGSSEENYQIIQLGEMIGDMIPGTNVEVIKEIKDKRTYRVSFDKIIELGFKVEKNLKQGISEMIDAFNQNLYPDPQDKKYYNYIP